MRQDVNFSGSATLVMLHEDESTALRILMRGNPNAYITPKIPVGPIELERMGKHIAAIVSIRRMEPQLLRWDFGAITLALNGSKVALIHEGRGLGFTPASSFATAIDILFSWLGRSG